MSMMEEVGRVERASKQSAEVGGWGGREGGGCMRGER